MLKQAYCTFYQILFFFYQSQLQINIISADPEFCFQITCKVTCYIIISRGRGIESRVNQKKSSLRMSPLPAFFQAPRFPYLTEKIQKIILVHQWVHNWNMNSRFDIQNENGLNLPQLIARA